MNPFNLLVNYVIANSRATFYNVAGNQEITNTALLTGMISENPLMSYLVIDNKAKIEGEKLNAVVVSTPSAGTANTPGLPAPGLPPVITPPVGTGVPTGTAETLTGTEKEGTACADTVTLEAVKNEILANNRILKEEFTKSLESYKAELNKLIVEKLDTKIAVLEKSNISINESIEEIKKRLGEISNVNQTQDTSTGNKSTPSQKVVTKNDPK
ncbi:hypothetical protein [Flavobacterium ajazii]|uniref:hypothetical protein n=1 Tax=Flavobacterium ajazii TaxID=2692318 RepID=UPI0013D84E70|nr:hypothetical protein [Flavobacterium ajazii]